MSESKNEPSPFLHRVLWTLLVLVMVGLGAALAVRSFHDAERRNAEEASASLPPLGTVGAFKMVDSAGQTVTDKDLAGKIWVVQFFFTECPGPCPMVSRQLFALQSMLGKARDVRLVSISIDPEHDTPGVLTDYAKRMGADPARWLFLAGTPEMTKQLVTRQFMIGFQENPKDQQAKLGRFVHSTKLALVDATGTIRGYYDGLDLETPQKVLNDISILMNEEGIH